MYEGPNRNPNTARHLAKRAQLPIEWLIFVFLSSLGYLAIWRPWRNDFNRQMTSDC